MIKRFSIVTIYLAISLSAIYPRGKWFGHIDPNDISRKKKLSIVFAGENLKTPASLFGHTFLLAHNHEDPEPDAIVVEYLADTGNRKFNRFNALFGSVPGRFKLTRYADKMFQYDHENRDIWIYELKKPEIDLELIQGEVTNNLYKNSPYNFFSTNCSYYLYSLLQKDHKLKVFYTVPIQTIKELRKNNKIKSITYRPSALRLLEIKTKSLTGKERDDLKMILHGYSCGDQCSSREEFTSAVGHAINYRIRREPSHLLRSHLMNEKKKFPISDKYLLSKEDPEKTTHVNSAALEYTNTSQLIFTFHPAYTNFYTQSGNSRSYRSLEIFQSRWLLSDKDQNLLEFNLFRMEAVIAKGYFHHGFVRYLDLSFYNWSVFHNAKDETVARFGIGYALNLFWKLQLGVLPVIGIRVVDIDQKAEFAGNVGFRIYLHQSPFKFFRYKVVYQYDFSNVVGFNELWSVELVLLDFKHWNLSTTMNFVNDTEESSFIRAGINLSW